MTKRYAFLVVLPFLILALAPITASAAYLAFVETADSTAVSYDNNFECGIGTSASGETAHVEACWITLSPPGYQGTGVLYMVEPASDPNAGAISDKLTVQFSVDASGLANAVFDFTSDSDGGLLSYPAPGLPVLVEDGTLQLVLGYFFDPATGAGIELPANLELRVQSDVTEAVPTQPTTWGLLKSRY